MRELSIDIETFSSVDIKSSGVYRYTEAEDFAILLFAYSVDGGPVRLIDLTAGEHIPDEILQALSNPEIQKWAYNANFERVALSKYLGYRLEPNGWYCSAVWASTLGLPRSLEDVGDVLGLDKQKLKEGKELIRYFCLPCKPTKANGQRVRNLPVHAPEKWELFKSYNIRDVEAESEIREKLKKFKLSEELWQEYWLDQIINDRGILADKVLATQAVSIDETIQAELKEKLVRLTGLDNPGSVSQLKGWLEEQGEEVESLGKKAVAKLAEETEGATKEVLALRLQSAKSSVKKYQAVLKTINQDDRIRGLFMFYGANRTGRFAGRLVQLQNLPQNHIEDLAEARALVRSGNIEALKLLYDIPSTLSELIRTVLIPSTGRFIVADFSAIEARVIAWIAGESWRQEVFKQGGDIYCASASQMFKVPVVKHGINGHLRQKGKIAELACGYGGGTGALISMGALDMGIPEEELQGIIDDWRSANPNICRLWKDIEATAKEAIASGAAHSTHGLTFYKQGGVLFIRLYSGRNIAYIQPSIGTNRFGSPSIVYLGTDGNTKKWTKLETYGGKLVENIVQAVARDLLVQAMQRLEAKGYRIVAHVHDEVIIEAQEGQTLDEAVKIMSLTPDWAEGLILNADGYECPFYKKD